MRQNHFILIKGAIHQREITIINLHAPNVCAPSFMKHTLKYLKSHKVSKTVVVGDFNIPLSSIDRSSREKNQQRNPKTK
jgi:exonuclease III